MCVPGMRYQWPVSHVSVAARLDHTESTRAPKHDGRSAEAVKTGLTRSEFADDDDEVMLNVLRCQLAY